MKKVIHALIISMALLYGYNSMAQCNSTFAYVQQGSFTYKFTANQVEQQGYTYNYTWSFGTGDQFYTPTVTEYFYSEGNYPVCLIVSVQDSHGTQVCSDSTCTVVIALPVSQCFPNLYFNDFQTPGTTQVQFNNGITDYTNVTVNWIFGDGTQQSGVASPSHFYPSYGTYNVCLYAVDTVSHCGDTICNLITLDSCPSVSSISWEQNTDGQDTISFYTYGSTQVNVWSFGDGSSNQTSVGDITHAFPGTGEYLVCLTAGSGSCQVNSCDSVIVDNCTQGVNFQFSYVSDSLLQVVFYQPQDLNNLNYSNPVLSFGDGTDTSNYYFYYMPHNYPALGTYVACFSVYINGCGTITQCDTINLVCNLAATFTGEQMGTNTIEYVLDTLQNYPGEIYQWTFGDGDNDNAPHPVHVYSQPGNYNACLTVTDTLTGCTASSYCNNVTPTIWSDTICGHIWVDVNMNGVQDSMEPNYQSCQLNVFISGGANLQLFTDSNGNYTAVVPSNQFLSIDAPFINNVSITMPAWGYGYNYSFQQTNQRQCGFDFGLVTNTGTITGYVYDDLDLDGQYDNSDVPIPNQIIDVNGQPAAVSTSFYGFRILEPAGSYTINVDANSYYSGLFPILPAQLQPIITSPGAQSANNNFAINVPTTYNDLGIDIIPGNPLVPGWYAYYQVMVTNYGANLDTAGVDYSFNTPVPLQLYNSNSGSAYLNSIVWASGSIYPFNGVLSQPVYTIDPATPINTDVYDTANIINYTDANAGNNSDTCHQITVSSYDPNNKLASQSGFGPTGLIPKDQILKYVINFQNTGTSDAINIVVRDVLDANLDLKTIRYIGCGSYTPPNILISGDTVYFRFSGIDLPDSSTSQIDSKNWLAFSIKPKTTVTGGSEIHNAADIYFDYNTPVHTNTTLHTIEGPLSVTSITDDGELSISPNPFGAQTNIKLQNMPGEQYTYLVDDILGRTVLQGTIHNNQSITLNRGTMSAGTYIISFYNAEGIVKRAKIIAQ